MRRVREGEAVFVVAGAAAPGTPWPRSARVSSLRNRRLTVARSTACTSPLKWHRDRREPVVADTVEHATCSPGQSYRGPIDRPGAGPARSSSRCQTRRPKVTSGAGPDDWIRPTLRHAHQGRVGGARARDRHPNGPRRLAGSGRPARPSRARSRPRPGRALVLPSGQGFAGDPVMIAIEPMGSPGPASSQTRCASACVEKSPQS